MKREKLTDIRVEKLPFADKGKQVDYYDSELDGFGVRVSATGKKYFARAIIGGKRVRVMMKSTKLISAQKAREEAKVKLGVMAEGTNPNEVEREKNRQDEERRQKEKQQGTTLQAALDDYVKKTVGKKGPLKPRTIATYQDLFRLYLADWLNEPAAKITRDMVKQRHSDIASGKRQRQTLKKEIDTIKGRKNKPRLKAAAPADTKRREAAADNCMRTLRAVLNYAFEDEENGTLYVNPVNILSSRKRKAWFKVDERCSLIKNSDLPAWYKAVNALDNAIMRDYLLFLLFTGLRRQEAARLRWKQVDFQEGCFTITDTKNRAPHTLPLSDYLYTLLTARKEGLKTELAEAKAALAGIDKLSLKQQQTAHNRLVLAESRLASPYVFPGEGNTGYIVEPKRAIDAVTADTGITFSCHDLRRTFATIAESLGLSIYTIKALLNHKQDKKDVTAGYIQIVVDRLREPMQKITDSLQERVKTQHGKVFNMQGRAEQ